MHTGKGQLLELILEDGCRYLRVTCPPNLIPAPGQYVLASDGSDSPLPVPLFYTDSAPQGFIAVAYTDTASSSPGQALYLRGPLGRGFALPLSARKVALVALDDSPARLRSLIQPALKRDASVVLVSSSAPDNLPDDVEVQPLSALDDILVWADYVAFDISRENLPQWKERLRQQNQWMAGMGAQGLIRTPVPCGGLAECGVCAVTLKSEWRLACKDGPVFDWKEL
jgi:NAD(P)H-flavin reductase